VNLLFIDIMLQTATRSLFTFDYLFLQVTHKNCGSGRHQLAQTWSLGCHILLFFQISISDNKL